MFAIQNTLPKNFIGFVFVLFFFVVYSYYGIEFSVMPFA